MIFWSNRAYIKHMQQEIEWYRAQLDYERERANHAVDQLLALKVQAAPITPLSPSVKTAEQKAQELFDNSEFATIGSVT